MVGLCARPQTRERSGKTGPVSAKLQIEETVIAFFFVLHCPYLCFRGLDGAVYRGDQYVARLGARHGMKKGTRWIFFVALPCLLGYLTGEIAS